MEEYKNVVENRKACYKLMRMGALKVKGKRSMMRKSPICNTTTLIKSLKQLHFAHLQRVKRTRTVKKRTSMMEENKVTEAWLRGLRNYKHMRIEALKPKIPIQYIWVIY